MACVASLAVAAPVVLRVRIARRAPAPLPARAALGARMQRVAPRRVTAAALGNKDEGGGDMKPLSREKEPEEARPRCETRARRRGGLQIGRLGQAGTSVRPARQPPRPETTMYK
jgi:hypothetical protein